ncbi:mucin-2-like [Sardina pilchardus]|uniref:mucin-2-like n=1 Tax=Sardina pilchardus TaxID=27697 RepID=UPI002E0FE437
MKPTWIVLLLVSFSLLHTEAEDATAGDATVDDAPKDETDPKDTDPPTAPSTTKPTTTKAVTPTPTALKETTKTPVTPVSGAEAGSTSSKSDPAAVTPVSDAKPTTCATTEKMNEKAVSPTLSGSDITNIKANDTGDNATGTDVDEEGTAIGKDNNTDETDKPLPGTDGTKTPAGHGENNQQSGQNTPGETKEEETDRKILWILLPVLGVLVAGVIFVLKFKCMKVQGHAEPTENGTENASFQRSDSNKDGVMLLGVKSSGGEENAAAR